VQGDGDQKIEEVRFPIPFHPFCHPFCKKKGEVHLSFIFPMMDGLLERPFIGSQSPCYCKIISVGQTSTTRVIVDLFRDKGNSTDGAKGRFDPVYLRKTLRADPLLPLF
jgi:hypothetical protein